MKRTPLARRTPLVAKAPLVSHKPLVSRCELRRTPINPVSKKQAAMQRIRVLSERDLGRDADGRGTCARCGRFGEVHGHELRNRSHGGDPANPDCLLCNPCNERVENGDRRLMCFSGWKIDPRHPHDPHLQVGQAWDLAGNLVIFTTPETADA